MKKLLATIFLLTACFISRSYGETIYFIVGEIDPNYNSSYVLPLTDANAIAAARFLIEDPDQYCPVKSPVLTISYKIT